MFDAYSSLNSEPMLARAARRFQYCDDVYGSLGSAQDSKCASSAILGKDFLTSSPPSYLGQAPSSGEKKFPTALVVGGLIVGGALLYYATQVGGSLAANPVVDTVVPLLRAGRSTVFLTDSNRSHDATLRMVRDQLRDPYLLDASISYMGLVNTAKDQPGRAIVITNAQGMRKQTIDALKVIKNQLVLVGTTEPEGFSGPPRPEDREAFESYAKRARSTLRSAAKALGVEVITNRDGQWQTSRDNPGRTVRNNDEYSPFPVERLPGGRASGMSPSDFDPGELRRGTEHELEHTGDRRLAQEIAMDHLAEDEGYYQKLDAMERGAFRDNPKLRWQGSGSGSWARGANYKYYRLLQRAPGDWLVYFDDVVIGAERTPALAKRLAQDHAGRRAGGSTKYVISFQTRRGSGQPGPWTVPDGDFATFEEAQDSARNTLARSTAFLTYRITEEPRRDNPWSKASCEKDCRGTYEKFNKPRYLKKCLAGCRGTVLGKGLADLPKGA